MLLSDLQIGTQVVVTNRMTLVKDQQGIWEVGAINNPPNPWELVLIQKGRNFSCDAAKLEPVRRHHVNSVHDS